MEAAKKTKKGTLIRTRAISAMSFTLKNTLPTDSSPLRLLHPATSSGSSMAAPTFGPFPRPFKVSSSCFYQGVSFECNSSPTPLYAGAQESIYILDWWLSPELYLRRPPSRNEQYRLDVMLQAAAERGVKVHIIVYKEVEAALTLDSAVCLSQHLVKEYFDGSLTIRTAHKACP